MWPGRRRLPAPTGYGALMSVTAARTVTIAAPLEGVLATVRDVAGQPQWWPGMLGSEVLEEDEEGRVLRARITTDVKVLTDTFEVAYEHPDDGLSWSLQGSSRAQRAQQGSWSLIAEGEVTVATMRLEIATSVPLPKLVQRRIVGDAVADAAAGLQRHCEAGAT